MAFIGLIANNPGSRQVEIGAKTIKKSTRPHKAATGREKPEPDARAPARRSAALFAPRQPPLAAARESAQRVLCEAAAA
ncbi:hypothetical protein SKAU_G00318650 [Synaphobranchus kaupii]|uniref:Uncharacterized protein n=1 Tax=Synaphobranchus kaupii TaxID=118154 RepID=A0A9Q1ET51_SYNKA|nr:hypothetical protein SKAU_G00318650 [Synaphobranchus kaupii]